jgi:hypothetical protein
MWLLPTLTLHIVNSPSKEPASALLAGNRDIPTVVFWEWLERIVAWALSRHEFVVGGFPAVQLMFLLQWTKIAGGKVKGVVEVYEKDVAGPQSDVLFNQLLR